MKTTHKTGLKMGHVSFDGPAPAQTYKEQLERKIAEKQYFIKEYPNYQWLCKEAELYIKWAEERIAAIEQQPECRTS